VKLQRVLCVGVGVLLGLGGAAGAYGLVRLNRQAADVSESVCARWPVSPGQLDGQRVQSVLIQPRNVAFEQRPFGYWSEPFSDVQYLADDAGIPMIRIGGRLFYQPTLIAEQGIRLLNSYHWTGQAAYLGRAESMAVKLLQLSQLIDGARYFRYEFPFSGPAGDVAAPWYSGPGQGLALSFFSRFADLHAGAGTWRPVADEVFQSLRLGAQPPSGTPVASLDSTDHYWIIEYPQEAADPVFNGFIVAAYGLYDYWRSTGDDVARGYFDAAVATAKDYVGRFRAPGAPMYYDLDHKSQSAKYHMFVIAELDELQRLTIDPCFDYWSRTLASDFNVHWDDLR
jgi:hypothetical protein